MIKEICVVGAESTGTTTMAKALAEQYKTVWIPEYGRLYAEAKLYTKNANQWTTDEFVHIAQEQSRLEDTMKHLANKVLICDTNAFATAIWHERYMGKQSEEVKQLASQRKYDLYLLTDVAIPFVQDGTRDGEHIREWMHHRFESELQKQSTPYAVLSGNHEKRLKKAITIIDTLLKA
jgi:HTH-type transcriptional repressor of NAD biosynthesis genes